LDGWVAFFDIGDTLAKVVFSPEGDEIKGLEVFPGVPGILEVLRRSRVSLGVISDRGDFQEEAVNEALKVSGFLKFFDPRLVIYGRKDSTQIFKLAAQRAREQAANGPYLFTGENSGERARAGEADFLVADRPSQALSVLQRAAEHRQQLNRPAN
jgi:hypothetical protein